MRRTLHKCAALVVLFFPFSLHALTMVAATVDVTVDDILLLGLEMVGHMPHRLRRTRLTQRIQDFRGVYGVGPRACKAAFDDLQTTAIPEARIQKPCSFYFLVALNWLACYDKESDIKGRFACDPKTLRQHIQKYVAAIAALKGQKIVWDIDDREETFLISVDGVHLRINEPRKYPSARWCSHKFKSAGLSYEIAILIYESRVVWLNGPFEAAEHDRPIYKSALQKKIPKGKKSITDRGYRPNKKDKEKDPTVSYRNARDTDEVAAFKRRVRARHESFNARIEHFKVLKDPFRARKDRFKKHQQCFEAVCVLVQYDMEHGHPLFDV